MVETEIFVRGRKEPLVQIREQLLEKHSKYMRLFTEEQYHNLTESEIKSEFARIQEDMPDNPDETVEVLKKFQRKRHLMFWYSWILLSNISTFQ